jgi:hypothetical protein
MIKLKAKKKDFIIGMLSGLFSGISLIFGQYMTTQYKITNPFFVLGFALIPAGIIIYLVVRD